MTAGRASHTHGPARRVSFSELLTRLAGRDGCRGGVRVLLGEDRGEANAHELPGEGLGEMLPVGWKQADTIGCLGAHDVHNLSGHGDNALEVDHLELERVPGYIAQVEQVRAHVPAGSKVAVLLRGGEGLPVSFGRLPKVDEGTENYVGARKHVLQVA